MTAQTPPRTVVRFVDTRDVPGIHVTKRVEINGSPVTCVVGGADEPEISWGGGEPTKVRMTLAVDEIHFDKEPEEQAPAHTPEWVEQERQRRDELSTQERRRYWESGPGSRSVQWPPQERHTYTVPVGPKMLRETLSVAQSQITAAPAMQTDDKAIHRMHLQFLIDACDRKRPLDPDGVHRDNHTPECGCDQ